MFKIPDVSFVTIHIAGHRWILSDSNSRWLFEFFQTTLEVRSLYPPVLFARRTVLFLKDSNLILEVLIFFLFEYMDRVADRFFNQLKIFPQAFRDSF
jgi:hypothetical protein